MHTLEVLVTRIVHASAARVVSSVGSYTRIIGDKAERERTTITIVSIPFSPRLTRIGMGFVSAV